MVMYNQTPTPQGGSWFEDSGLDVNAAPAKLLKMLMSLLSARGLDSPDAITAIPDPYEASQKERGEQAAFPSKQMLDAPGIDDIRKMTKPPGYGPGDLNQDTLRQPPPATAPQAAPEDGGWISMPGKDPHNPANQIRVAKYDPNSPGNIRSREIASKFNYQDPYASDRERTIGNIDKATRFGDPEMVKALVTALSGLNQTGGQDYAQQFQKFIAQKPAQNQYEEQGNLQMAAGQSPSMWSVGPQQDLRRQEFSTELQKQRLASAGQMGVQEIKNQGEGRLQQQKEGPDLLGLVGSYMDELKTAADSGDVASQGKYKMISQRLNKLVELGEPFTMNSLTQIGLSNMEVARLMNKQKLMRGK